MIEADGSYLKPVNCDSILIDGGQRYSVLVTALTDRNNSFFIRSQRQSVHLPHPISFAILSYGNASLLPPEVPVSNWGKILSADELSMLDDSKPPKFSGKIIELNLFDLQPSTDWWNWTINNSLYNDPQIPFSCQKNWSNFDFFSPSLSFEFGEIYDIVWQNLNSFETHPIHHHGHKLWIISTGKNNWNISTHEFATPISRDTEILFGGGHIRYRFKADNPGIWAMHCHVEWFAKRSFRIFEKNSYSVLFFIRHMQTGFFLPVFEAVSHMVAPPPGLCNPQMKK